MWFNKKKERNQRLNETKSLIMALISIYNLCKKQGNCIQPLDKKIIEDSLLAIIRRLNLKYFYLDLEDENE